MAYNSDMPSYIWQRQDWPKLRYEPKAILNSLTEAVEEHGLLIGRLEGLGFRRAARYGPGGEPRVVAHFVRLLRDQRREFKYILSRPLARIISPLGKASRLIAS